MKRNLLLFFAVLVSILLIVNGTKRILSFRGTAQRVEEAQTRLDSLKAENEALKAEYEYKKSEGFTEEEIRNKLGLAKKGETIVVVPKEEESKVPETSDQRPENNLQKWWELFFGG